jgi:hypothetical protein
VAGYDQPVSRIAPGRLAYKGVKIKINWRCTMCGQAWQNNDPAFWAELRKVRLSELSKDDLLYPLRNPMLRKLYDMAVSRLTSRKVKVSSGISLDILLKKILSKALKVAPQASLEDFAKVWFEEVERPDLVPCYSQRRLSSECREKFEDASSRSVARLSVRNSGREREHEDIKIDLSAKFYGLITLARELVKDDMAEAIEEKALKILQSICSDLKDICLEAEKICYEALEDAKEYIMISRLAKRGITGKLIAELIREDRESR